MDIFAHTIWTSVLAKESKALAEKKKKKLSLSVGWVALFGVFPDFFAFTIPFVLFFYNFIISGFSLSFGRDSVTGFDLAPTLYQYSHSIIIFAIVFGVVWLVYKRPRFELLGWLLHILIDIPSHSIEFYPTPFLFPVSPYRFPYGVSWADKWFMIINYSAMLLAFSYILYKKYRRKSETVEK